MFICGIIVGHLLSGGDEGRDKEQGNDF